jgi:hypothetical protein
MKPSFAHGRCRLPLVTTCQTLCNVCTDGYTSNRQMYRPYSADSCRNSLHSCPGAAVQDR